MILIIDNYDSFTYNLYQLVASLHFNIKVVRNDVITVDDVEKMRPSAIILSPGPGTPEKAGICIELIQKMYKTTPILGVCLGHQAIVSAFGGKITQADEIIHGKSSYIFHNRQQIYKNVPIPFAAGRYHSLIATKNTLPDCLQINAENENGQIMGVKHKNFPVFGVQFHPESILTPCGCDLIYNFLDEARLC